MCPHTLKLCKTSRAQLYKSKSKVPQEQHYPDKYSAMMQQQPTPFEHAV